MPRRYLASAILTCAGCIVGASLAEISLRLMGIAFPRYEVQDELLGYVLRPGLEWEWRTEGRSYVRINSRGLRDREHDLTKPPNTLRIAVLGDSYAEAFQVPMEKAFWSVAERELGRCPGFGERVVEVVNFGVSGYGTARELMMLRHRVWAYSPDIVVLAFFAGNDIANNSRALDRAVPGPYFVRQSGQLVLDDSFRYSESFRTRQSSVARAYYEIYNRLRVLQVLINARHSIQKSLRAASVAEYTRDTVGSEPGLNDEIYFEPRDITWRDAWAVTEDLIIQMEKEVTKGGAQFLLVTLSTGIQVHPDPTVRQQFMRRLGVDDLFYPEHRLSTLGEKHGIQMLALAPHLQRYAAEHQVYLHGFQGNLGFGHWNEAGHRIGGEMVAGKLCSPMAPPS